jgi:ATP-dependent Clp protease ATP-binding subunit ClpA
VYPFERFTADAKKTLTLAQEEAERSHHSYIGTEHLLLGLLRLRGGVGYQALVDLGIEIGPVRETIAAVLGRNERIIIQQIIPTSRVKKVIEISFEEARRMGQNFVNSGHLLLGLVIEGEGIAAHVLADLGASRENVTATVGRLMREQPPEPEWQGDFVDEELQSSVEALARLLKRPHIANLLRARGLTDVEGLGAKLGEPPLEVVKLRAQLRQAQTGERDLRRKLERAEQDWLRKIIE